MTDIDKLRAELAAARAEIKDLKQALVTMCDVYSANRAEKLKVKAFRRHGAADAPFSLAEVEKTFGLLKVQADNDEKKPR